MAGCDLTVMFQRSLEEQTRGHRFRLVMPCCNTDVRKRFFNVRCIMVWNVGYEGDTSLIESVQRRWTKNIDGLRGLTYRERLKSLKLFSTKGRLLRTDLIKY